MRAGRAERRIHTLGEVSPMMALNHVAPAPTRVPD
jgi:hypothetical protein